MQDEHFMKLWCESRRHLADARASLPAQPSRIAISPDALLMHCRARLAKLLGVAVPGGFVLGVIGAVIAATATVPAATQSPAPEPATIASYTLPYPA